MHSGNMRHLAAAESAKRPESQHHANVDTPIARIPAPPGSHLGLGSEQPLVPGWTCVLEAEKGSNEPSVKHRLCIEKENPTTVFHHHEELNPDFSREKNIPVFPFVLSGITYWRFIVLGDAAYFTCVSALHQWKLLFFFFFCNKIFICIFLSYSLCFHPLLSLPLFPPPFHFSEINHWCTIWGLLERLLAFSTIHSHCCPFPPPHRWFGSKIKHFD